MNQIIGKSVLWIENEIFRLKNFFDGDVTTCHSLPPPLSPLVTNLSDPLPLPPVTSFLNGPLELVGSKSQRVPNPSNFDESLTPPIKMKQEDDDRTIST